MTLLRRFSTVACTAPDKLAKQDGKMHAPRHMRTWGAVMEIGATEMRRMGAKRFSSSVVSCDDLCLHRNMLWERSQWSNV